MKKEKGAILITSLWILAILAVMAVGIGFRSAVELRLSKYNLDMIGARYMAKAGIAAAEKMILTLEGIPAFDTLKECGIKLVPGLEGDSAESRFIMKTLNSSVPVSAGNKEISGTYSVYYEMRTSGPEGAIERMPGLQDEESKININMYDKNKPAQYMDILRILSQNKMTDEVIYEVIDWIDPDDEKADGSGIFEKDSGDYVDLGYDRKNKPFTSVEELLLVKGMTPEIFNLIKDYITVYGEDKKVNINTACRHVLTAIIGDSNESLAAVDEVINARNAENANLSTMDAYAHISVPQFLNVKSIFKVDSQYYKIISHGHYNKMEDVITEVFWKKNANEWEVKFYNDSPSMAKKADTE